MIRRAQVRCDAELKRHLDHGMSPARFAALVRIAANPGISQAELGALLDIAGPSVVKLVDDLEYQGLVRRGADIDRRVHALTLTGKGSAAYSRQADAVERFERKIACRLSAEERRKLIALLKRVALEE